MHCCKPLLVATDPWCPALAPGIRPVEAKSPHTGSCRISPFGPHGNDSRQATDRKVFSALPDRLAGWNIGSVAHPKPKIF
jgi:hypothetical protein